MNEHVYNISSNLEPYTFDEYTICHHERIGIKIQNIRFQQGKYLAEVLSTEIRAEMVNERGIAISSASGSSSCRDVTKAFNSPENFLKAFPEVCARFTSMQLALTIVLPDEANEVNEKVKNFCQKKLTQKEKMDACLNAVVNKMVDSELSNRARDLRPWGYSLRRRVVGGLKIKLTQNVMSYVKGKANNVISNMILGGLICAALLGFVLRHANTIALTLSMNPGLLFGGAMLGVWSLPIVAGMVVSFFDKKKMVTLDKLGGLDNENVDTDQNKAQLAEKLSVILSPGVTRGLRQSETEACQEAIDIGQAAQSSQQHGWLYGHFQLAKSCFNKNAYHTGYYVGKEMERKRMHP